MNNLLLKWCVAHGYKYKIISNHFYWQTNFQTGEIDENGNQHWHTKEYFEEVTNS